MARAGLGPDWDCAFANDFDVKKGLAYQTNWGVGGELRIGDVGDLAAADMPGIADLVWGSFPCQDLSLAGGGAGLKGSRSGAFHPFWKIIEGLIADRRAPKIIALENVPGMLTSRNGLDFNAVCQTFADADYRYGALTIDASLFVPQSRMRLFIIGVRADVDISPSLLSSAPQEPFHSRRLRKATSALSSRSKKKLLWWRVPPPPFRTRTFADILEDESDGVKWRSATQTKQLLGLMSVANLAKVHAAQRAGRRMVGGVYKRTRIDENGGKAQRAEVRFDDIAGCLRTPSGGSSRQTILVVDGNDVRSRLVSARETARLMGLDDKYALPQNYNEAYHLTGDGVVVPVVRHIACHLFEPLLGVAAPDKANDISPRTRN